MKFSVVVPIYNVDKYIRKCIDSILAQTFTDFELVLVDDGSPDKCGSICDEYKKLDERVRVIHKKNGGLVAARNTGIKVAKGDYICYVDGDDWIAPNLLSTVWQKALRHTECDIVVYSAVKVFEKSSEEIPYEISEGLYDKEKLKNLVYPYMMYDKRKPFCSGLIFPVAWNKIFKREFLLEHYCQEERIRMGEDNAFVFECMYAAEKVYFCSEKLYYYNQLNANSMVHSYDANRFVNNKYLVDYIESRLSGKDSIIDSQINAFKAYWLTMAVFHEVKCNRGLFEARKHISQNIKSTNAAKSITLKGLPKSAQLFVLMLKLDFNLSALIAAKIISKRRR